MVLEETGLLHSPSLQPELARKIDFQIFLFFFRLGSYPLMNPDEGRNAQVPLEMHVSSAGLVPTLNGHPYLDKSETVNIGEILVRMD